MKGDNGHGRPGGPLTGEEEGEQKERKERKGEMTDKSH